jgi:O-antigen/teichoic acid export membrane protein
MLRKIALQNLLSYMTQFVVPVFGFAFALIFSRLLGTQDYGLLMIFISFVMLLSTLCDFGMQTTIIRFVGASMHARDGRAGAYLRRLFLIKLSFAAPICAAAFALAPFLAALITHDASNTYLFQAASIVAFAYAFIPFMDAVFSAANRYEYGVLSSALLNALRIALALLFFYAFGASAQSAISGVSVAFLAATLLTAALFFRLMPRASAGSADYRAMRGYFTYAALISTFSAVFAGSDAMLVGAFGDSTGVALYRNASQIAGFLLMLMPFSTRFVLSSFIELEATGRQPAAKKMFGRMLKYGLAVSLPLSALVLLFAERILTFLYPPAYAAAAPALQVLAAAVPFVFVETVCLGVLFGRDRIRSLFYFTAVTSLSIFTLNVALIPAVGFVGAAASFLAVHAAASAWTFARCASHTGVRMRKEYVLKPALLSLAVAAALSYARAYPISTPLLISAGALAYSLAYLLLMDDEDRALMGRFIGALRSGFSRR